MISVETTQAFMASMKEDPNWHEKLLPEFLNREPNAAGMIMLLLNADVFQKNPVTTAFIALAMYDKMAATQSASDRLKRQIGGS